MAMYPQNKKSSTTSRRVTNPAFPGGQPVNPQLIAAVYPARNCPVVSRPAQPSDFAIETEAITEVNRDIGRRKDKLELSQLVTRNAERLLNHHRLSRRYGFQRHSGMKIIGRGDRDRIDPGQEVVQAVKPGHSRTRRPARDHADQACAVRRHVFCMNPAGISPSDDTHTQAHCKRTCFILNFYKLLW